jgi:hypothetical protein
LSRVPTCIWSSSRGTTRWGTLFLSLQHRCCDLKLSLAHLTPHLIHHLLKVLNSSSFPFFSITSALNSFLYMSRLISPSRLTIWNHSISLISFLLLVRVFLYYSSSRWRRSRTRWVIVPWCCAVLFVLTYVSLLYVFDHILNTVCCCGVGLLIDSLFTSIVLTSTTTLLFNLNSRGLGRKWTRWGVAFVVCSDYCIDLVVVFNVVLTSFLAIAHNSSSFLSFFRVYIFFWETREKWKLRFDDGSHCDSRDWWLWN